MNTESNIKRIEDLIHSIHRPGVDKLINYLQKSDFYKAPASTKYHLSTEGGLLQHSLNVYDAAMARLSEEDGQMVYKVAGHEVARFPKEAIILTTLLHDLCKTNFYTVEMRNQKVYKEDGSKRDNGGRFDWEQVPVYAINDKNPYGHGEKSVMMIEEFMKLTMEERYAIRWHMGMSDCTYSQVQAFNESCEKFPLVLLVHNADQEASHFMEDKAGNKVVFEQAAQPATDYVDQDTFYDGAFMEAATI